MTFDTVAGTAGPSGPAGSPANGAFAQAAPADPAGTASATAVMMGLAVAFTPVNTGRVLIVASGDVANDTISKTSTVAIRTGPGAAPANGDPPAGTQRGVARLSEQGVAAKRVPWSTQAALSGLTLNTAIWIDLALAAPGGGTATLKATSITAVEM